MLARRYLFREVSYLFLGNSYQAVKWVHPSEELRLGAHISFPCVSAETENLFINFCDPHC